MEGKCESQNERQLKTKALNMSSIKQRQPRSRIRKIKRLSCSDKSRSHRFHSLRLKIERRADHMLKHVNPREIRALVRGGFHRCKLKGNLFVGHVQMTFSNGQKHCRVS